MKIHHRRLIIDGELWTYYIGKQNVKLRDPKRKGYFVDFSTLTGLDWFSIEKGMWKKWLHITPRIIEVYIRENLLKGTVK